MMTQRRTWLWISLLVAVLLLLGTLGTSWNLLLVQNYQKMARLVEQVSIPPLSNAFQDTPPWLSTVLGSLGFLAVLAVTLLVFLRLFREMKLNEIQREFLAKVSHELRTPISTIELSSTLLQEQMEEAGTLDAEARKLWQLHDDELNRLKAEVASLLKAARWEVQAIEPELRSISLRDWINRSFPKWERLIGENAKLQLTNHFTDQLASLDEELLDLITHNIVDNAKKFARAPGAELMIHTEVTGEEWKIHFQDSGWGFSPHSKRRIFRRFYRDQQPPQHAIGGTGLGLFLAQKAAKAMNLRLIGESLGLGQGARFCLEGKVLLND